MAATTLKQNIDRLVQNALRINQDRADLLAELKEAVELGDLEELPSAVTLDRWEKLIARV
jgi:aryl carrier-like protein